MDTQVSQHHVLKRLHLYFEKYFHLVYNSRVSFFHQHFKYVKQLLFFVFFCLLFFCFHFRWEVLCHFIFAPLYIVCLFSLNEFHYFSLSLVLSNLIRLGVVFFMFLLLAICGASWSVSFQQIWNAFYYLFEHIFCLPPPSGTPFTHILNWSMHIDALFISFSLFSLHFFLESLYCHVFRFSNVFFCSI